MSKDITEKIGAEELLLDPTKTVQKCGITVSAITAHSLMVNPEGLGWENFYDWIVKLHLGIKDLAVKPVGDTLDITWKGSNDVLIYIDSLAGVHPNGTNHHIMVVGRGDHTVEIREVGHEVGLKASVQVQGTAIAPQAQIKVSDVTTSSFTVEVLNYVDFTVKIGSTAKSTLPNPFTVTGLSPETSTSMTFYDRYGNNIGLFTVTTDDVSHETQPPAIPSNQVVTFQENDEIGSMLNKIDWDTRGLPIIQAHIDDPIVKDYFTVTTTGHIVPIKDLDYETLPPEWLVNGTVKEITSRVAIQTSAGGGANYVKFQISDVSEQAPSVPLGQTFDLTENTGTLGQVLGTGAFIINDNGSPITKVEISGSSDVYVMVKENGDIVSTGVKPDFEQPNVAPNWRAITPNGGGALRIENDLYVTVYNANGKVTRKLPIRIVNMPDTKPSIDTTTPLAITLAENTAVGTFLGTVPVRDDGTAITSATISNIGAYVLMDNAGNITANAPADFEALKTDATWTADGIDKVYKEGVVAFTNAHGTTTAPIRLTVTDVADDKPKVTDLVIEVAENTVVGTTVGTIPVVTDVSSPVTAAVLDAPLSEYLDVSNTGVLTLKKSPNFEDIPTFILVSGRMIAQSDATFVNAFGSGKGTVLMKVTNVADTLAAIPIHQTFSVDESKPIGTYVGTLSYTVGDNVLEGFIIGSPASDYFQIDSQGNITVSAVPDYETLAPEWGKDPLQTMAAVNTPVSMKIQGKPNLIESVSFKVMNLADTKPFIQLNQTFGSVENNVAGSNLGTLVFNDMGNVIQNAKLSFPASKYFALDESGAITTKVSLDFEGLPPSEFTLDGSNKYLVTQAEMTNSIGTTQVPLRLQVLDVIDDKPVFVQPVTQMSTFENIPAGTVLGTVPILDMGSPLTSVTFEDVEMNTILNIALDGKVTIGWSPDYESLGTWAQLSPGERSKTVKVKAVNTHGSTEADFQLIVKDINEVVAPTITSITYPSGTHGLEFGGDAQLVFDNGGAPILSATIESAHANTIVTIDNTGKLTMLADPVLTGAPLSGWSPSPEFATYNSTVTVKLTNSAGSSLLSLPMSILNKPLTEAELRATVQAKTVHGFENTRLVTDFTRMFSATPPAIFDYNPPSITRWDVSNVTDFDFMASENPSFNPNIDMWVTSSATNMRGMFNQATSFNQNISHFNMSKVLATDSMLASATSFDQVFANIFDMGNVENARYMFGGASKFRGIGMETWDTKSIKYFDGMVRGTIVDRDLTAWSTAAHVSHDDFHLGGSLQQTNCPALLW